MRNGQDWLPETVINLLTELERYYVSVGFRRTASLMRTSLSGARTDGSLPSDFYGRYVSLLKDDSRDMVSSFGFDEGTKETFIRSVSRSIDMVSDMLAQLDSEGRTPTFSGSAGKADDRHALETYINEYGISDPVSEGLTPYEVLSAADGFYNIVHDHVFVPGRSYLVSQLELAVGRDRTLAIVEELLCAEKTIRENGIAVSDFEYAFVHPGTFTKDMACWHIADGLDVSVGRFARWPLLVYYKTPILTSMLPVHNVIFFTLVQDAVEKRRETGSRLS